jgi:predicted GIY-YIG superfamily endonuclease
VVVPYVKGLSEKVRRINKKFGIRTAFKNKKDLRSLLTKVKPDNKEDISKNIVYQIPCSCGRNYYGQTSRPADVRISEHRKLLARADQKSSKLVEHVMMTDHSVDWSSAAIVAREDKWKERNIVEAAFMAVDTACISQPSASIHPMFIPSIEGEIKWKTKNATMVYNRTPPLTDNADKESPVQSVASRRSERLRGRTTSLAKL